MKFKMTTSLPYPQDQFDFHKNKAFSHLKKTIKAASILSPSLINIRENIANCCNIVMHGIPEPKISVI